MNNTLTGAELIAQERKEQIEKHNRSVEDDVRFNVKGQLIDAARQLIKPDNERNPVEKSLQARGFTPPFTWDIEIFSKMISKPYKERLIIAGALIAAEIDRLNHTTNE